MSIFFPAFCPKETTALSRGIYNWSRTEAEMSEYLECVYRGIGVNECDIVDANVIRLCNEYGLWMEPNTNMCYTESTLNLCSLRNVRG